MLPNIVNFDYTSICLRKFWLFDLRLSAGRVARCFNNDDRYYEAH